MIAVLLWTLLAMVVIGSAAWGFDALMDVISDWRRRRR